MTNHIVIFDTEYTSWEGSFERKWSLDWEHREIIQISAIKLDIVNQYRVVSEFNIFVLPKINLILSDYIQNLTGITQDDLTTKGLSFKKALELFREYCEDDQVKAYCWGADEDVLEECCKINALNLNNYFHGFYDIRDAVKKAGIDPTNYQSGTIYKSVNPSLNLKQHDALNDVKSIVYTLTHLHENNLLIPEMIFDCGRSKTNS
jgi:inhibitor of KinA sporulation pathway (predicted exonuclease)